MKQVDSEAQFLELRRQLNTMKTRDRPSGFSVAATFPASPSTGLRVYRSDLNLLCFYDGARWLTVEQFALVVPSYNRALAVAGVNGATMLRTDFAPFFTRVALSYRVDTTNNGSNFWTITLRGRNAARSAATTVHAVNTSAASAGAYVVSEAAPSGTANPTNRQVLDLDFALTGTPGAIECDVTVFYRLIVT